MLRANVARFLELTESFNRIASNPKSADRDDVMHFLGFLAPAIDFEPQQALLQGRYVGRDGVREWLADLTEHYKGGHMRYADIRDLGDDRVLALGALRVTAEEYRELDEERVLVLTHYSGRGKTSGVEVGHMPPKQAHLLHIRDGRVIRQVFYFERERALADLGLPAEAGSEDR